MTYLLWTLPAIVPSTSDFRKGTFEVISWKRPVELGGIFTILFSAVANTHVTFLRMLILTGLHPLVEQYTIGEDYAIDSAYMLPYDLKASEAHAEGLEKIGVISADELETLRKALHEIRAKWDEGVTAGDSCVCVYKYKYTHTH